jgi:hypothetical protein
MACSVIDEKFISRILMLILGTRVIGIYYNMILGQCQAILYHVLRNIIIYLNTYFQAAQNILYLQL